jgi:NAD(P)-dependent dehydrogenase (short-subunit alcohol dehydrogenase family)
VTTTNKVALITGANKGIGLETARQLGKTGVTVLVGARDAGRGETAAQTLRGEGIDARFVPLDVTNAASLADAAHTIGQDFGHLDILVNNAGVGAWGAASGLLMRPGHSCLCCGKVMPGESFT